MKTMGKSKSRLPNEYGNIVFYSKLSKVIGAHAFDKSIIYWILKDNSLNSQHLFWSLLPPRK